MIPILPPEQRPSLVSHASNGLASPRPPWGRRLMMAVLVAWCSGKSPAQTPTTTASTPRTVTLEECVRTALANNREIQIERVQPRLARLAIDAALGAYDPFLFSDVRWGSAADSGGYDPADFSRDAIYHADSEVAQLGMSGLAPGGLTYTLTSDYAHSTGVRNSLDFDSYSLRLGAALRQPLLKNLWIDRARFTIRSNRSRLKSSEFLVEYRVMDVIHRVVVAYHELGYALEHARAQRSLLDNRQTLLDQVRRLVAGGKMTAPDESLAASQAAAAAGAEAAARHAAVLAGHELKTLLGDAWKETSDLPLTPILSPAVAPVLPDLTESRASGLARRPDLAHLREEGSRTELDVRFWRNQLFPSLDVVGTYGRRGSSTAQFPSPLQADATFPPAWDEVARGDNPNHGIGFIFSMPLGRRVERSQYRTSHELRNLAELRIKQHEEWILREISDAHAETRSTWERLGLATRASQLAEEALRAEERRLTAGTSTLFVVLQLQGALADARVQEARAQADHFRGLSRLQFASGTILDAHQLAWNQPE